MNYTKAIELKAQYEYLKNSNLIKSNEWTITHVLVLPSVPDVLLGYTGHLQLRGYSNWIVTGFNHKDIYVSSGIYITADGVQANDDLTLYITLKNKKSNLNIEYKCEMLFNLIAAGEVALPSGQDASYLLQ